MLADAQRNCYVHQQMDTYKSSCIAQACGAQVASETSPAERINSYGRNFSKNMKKCKRCGKEYPDAAEACAADG